MPAFGGPAMATTNPSRRRSPRSLCKHRRNVAFERPGNLQSRRYKILRHVSLIGKVDARLNERKRLDQLRPPVLGPVPQRPRHLPEGLAPLPLRLGHYQVGKAFHRSQIELAVFKGAAREFARLRGSQTVDLSKCRKDRRDDGVTACS